LSTKSGTAPPPTILFLWTPSHPFYESIEAAAADGRGDVWASLRTPRARGSHYRGGSLVRTSPTKYLGNLAPERIVNTKRGSP